LVGFGEAGLGADSSGRGGHVEGVAPALSTAADLALAAELAVFEGERGDAGGLRGLAQHQVVVAVGLKQHALGLVRLLRDHGGDRRLGIEQADHPAAIQDIEVFSAIPRDDARNRDDCERLSARNQL
jgi:hypothetical protein